MSACTNIGIIWPTSNMQTTPVRVTGERENDYEFDNLAKLFSKLSVSSVFITFDNIEHFKRQ